MDIYEVLTRIENSNVSLYLNAPASHIELQNFKKFISEKGINNIESLFELYRITDGLEINVPGTCIYSVNKVIYHNTKANRSPEKNIVIGIFNFGDLIYLKYDGSIGQYSVDENCVVCTWNNLSSFLKEEGELI